MSGQKESIQLLIVDDQDIIRDGLSIMLGVRPNIEICGTAKDGVEALELVETHQPDIVLMDLKMPHMNGVQATRELKLKYPDMPIVILTTYDEDDWIMDAIRAGADGYLLKDAGKDDIAAAVEGALAGRNPVDPNVAEKLYSFVQFGPPAAAPFLDELNARERNILRLMASGLTNAAIGSHLNLAEGTVRNHVSQILSKLNVADRTQAVVLAWRYGLVRADTLNGLL
ncbi:MAG: response regulator transcription factor [Chloroflexota bacterium]